MQKMLKRFRPWNRTGALQVRRIPHAHQNPHHGDQRRPAVLKDLAAAARGHGAGLPHGQLLRPERRGATAGRGHRGTELAGRDGAIQFAGGVATTLFSGGK